MKIEYIIVWQISIDFILAQKRAVKGQDSLKYTISYCKKNY